MSHESGRGRHQPTTRRRRTLWVVAVFLAVDVVLGLTVGTVLPRLGVSTPWSASSSNPAPTSSASTSTTAAAGTPALVGYPVLNGNQGYPIAVGRPWGSPCAPIAVVAAKGTPDDLRARLDEVLSEAAAGGVPVLSPRPSTPAPSESGPGPLEPGPLEPGPTESGAASLELEYPVVQVAADTTSTPVLPDGRPQQVLWFLQTSLDPSGSSETIETVSTAVFVQAARDDVAQRRALRSLLARSFGLAGSTTAGSGLTAELGSALDSFSAADLAALRAMAGCS